MAFTHALYYPWIEINNPVWLKTAILYWDKISTIVPGYIESPYNDLDCRFLMDAGILVPEYVEPGDYSVQKASKVFLDYFTTPEAKAILLPGGRQHLRLPVIANVQDLAKLNRWKITRELRSQLLASGRVIEQDEYLYFDRESVNYYMSLLAAYLSMEKHFGPLTDNELFEPMTNRVRRGDNPLINPQELGQVLLAQMTISAIAIPPDTPIEALVDFRGAYGEEVGRFRIEMENLSARIDPETPSFDALHQQIHQVYLNQIGPAIQNLRKALQGRGLKALIVDLSSIIFAESLRFLPPDSLVVPAVYAGCKIAANRVSYMIDRKQQPREEPFSFVLSVEKQLT